MGWALAVVGKVCQVRAQQGLPGLPHLCQGCFRPSKRGVPTCVLPPVHIRTLCACCLHTKNVHGKNVHAVCTHVGPPALSRLLHPPFLSLRCAKVHKSLGGVHLHSLIRWLVMKRWLEPINRVREVFHPLECMSAPKTPSPLHLRVKFTAAAEELKEEAYLSPGQHQIVT